MKQELDRQMDSLLRGMKGGVRAAPRAPESAHLSTDALSAYAEQALPPATRARYTAHLADCADCRRIVAGVALAAGGEAVREARDVRTSQTEAANALGRRAWLAAIFSPRVLRYALPVLAIALVGLLAFVVMRRQPAEESQVVQQMPAESERRASVVEEEQRDATGAVAPGQVETGTSTATTQSADADGATTSTLGPPSVQESQGLADSAIRLEGADTSESVAVTEDKSKLETLPVRPESDPRNVSPANVGTTAAAPPSSLPMSNRSAQTEELAARPQKSSTENAQVEDDEVARSDSEPRQRRGVAGARVETAPASPKRRARSGDARQEGEYSLKRERTEDNKTAGRASSSAETRRVAGHEFRREDGAWVDVNFRSSMSTSNVRRGSERLRSLSADIPEIGRVAEQLGGTVIIVVRGRAYRIQ